MLRAIAAPGLQAPRQHAVAQHVDAARHRLPGNRECPCQLRLIEHLPLVVREHGPQAAQRGGRNAQA